MVRFTTSTAAIGVGTGGATLSIPVSKGFQSRRVVLFEATHDAGDATHTTVEFSTDSTFLDLNQRIATFVGLNDNAPVGHTNFGEFYTWDETLSGGIIYVRLTPDAEINNNYTIAAHMTEEVE